jgi:hypothetical protein
MVNPNTELHGSAIKIVKTLVLNVEDLEEKNDKRLLQIDMKKCLDQCPKIIIDKYPPIFRIGIRSNRV